MRVLALHAVAVAGLLGLAWFFLQPITGDVAFWTPAEASLLVAASFAIATGAFAWWRFASRRALIAGDVIALVPMAFVSLSIVPLPVTLTAASLLVVGIAGARNVRQGAGRAGFGTGRIAKVHPAALIAAIALAAIFTWFALGAVLGPIAPFIDYGLAEVIVAGTIWLALLFWLDRRPGTLLGTALAFLYFLGLRLINIDELLTGGAPELAQVGILVIAATIVAIATARATWRRPLVPRLASVAVAAVAAGTLATVQSAMPLALVLALAIERPTRRRSPEPADERSALEGAVS